MALPLQLQHLEHKLKLVDVARPAPLYAPGLMTGWQGLDVVLEGRGLPKGVVELCAQHGRGGATSVALSAVRAAQRASLVAWCAWLDPEANLYAPGVALSGVAPERLLVVRPPRVQLLRTALRVVRAAAFEVVVVDMEPPSSDPAPSDVRAAVELEHTVRKLSLLAEESSVTVLLLSNASVRRRAPLPVVLRLELCRRPEELCVRVAKDKRSVHTKEQSLRWSDRPQGLFVV